MSAGPDTLERLTIRRLTWRIVPLLMLAYVVAYLDRVNIGFAALTMNADLGLSSAAFGLGAGIFFLGYFLFEVPSNLILYRVGARRWIARIMLSWGAVSIAMAFVRGENSFYLLRFLLGFAEAGFFPGVILYLSHWFPARHRAGITALFMAAAPIATTIGSPVSGALLGLDGLLGLHGWQWLFIVEGAPAMLMAVAVWRLLTDRPEQAQWLAAEQRDWLMMALAREAPAAPGDHGLRQALRPLADPRVLALALIYFGTSAGLYTLGIWSPQMIARFGVDTMTLGVINAGPPALAVVAMIWWARHSDARAERPMHVAAACLAAAVGLVLAALSETLPAFMASLVLVNVGVSAAKPPLWAMPTLFLSGSAAAAGIAAINSVGNLGGFVGPSLIGWIHGASGSYRGGLVAVAALLALSAIAVTLLARFAPNHNRPVHRSAGRTSEINNA